MFAPALLLFAAAGCMGPPQIKTYRWGGQATIGRYLVDMGSIRRSGPQADFEVLFLPQATAAKPDMEKFYVLDSYRMDCVAGTSLRKGGAQAHLMNGFPVTLKSEGDAAPQPIHRGTTWASVRDLVCTGANDLSPTPLTGTTQEVATQARARMRSHPVVGPDAAS